MNIERTEFEGLVVLRPAVYKDERGYFMETHSLSRFKSNGLEYNFVQDNESLSSYGTLRGLHFQSGSYAQAKLVRVVKGSVLDVAVDLRAGQPTFGKVFTFELNEDNKAQLLIPRGFAHGFVVLSEKAIFQYKVDNTYSPENESGILYSDLDLNIDWRVPKSQIIISAKDQKWPTLKEYLNNKKEG